MDKIEALTAVLQDPVRSPAEKEIAARALRSVSASETSAGIKEPCQELSDDSRTMLKVLGKSHLREISEEGFARYAHHFDPSYKEKLCRQWREWVCPDDDVLDLIGLPRARYWKAVHDHAKSDEVRQNALAEMRKL